jgi:hypothetical protein
MIGHALISEVYPIEAWGVGVGVGRVVGACGLTGCDGSAPNSSVEREGVHVC